MRHEDLSIVLGGGAGQGIKTIENLLTGLLKRAGYHVFATEELMSRIRGGSSSTEIRIGNARPRAFVNRIDLCIALDSAALGHLASRLTERTVVAGEEHAGTGRFQPLPFRSIASELGGSMFASSVAVGVVGGALKLPFDLLNDMVKRSFLRKGQEIVDKNLTGARRGYEIGSDIELPNRSALKPTPEPAGEILMSGSEAVGLGAIAGGCNFISAYPMTPSSGVWTFLVRHAAEFGIISEQAEDEISAMNMAIGAWYAGGRALVTTSGGGFDLMSEGLSLVGAQESPMVIHLAQRPGPATGLPTRTEQGDLNLALHAGHGEFPRVILAPGRLEDGFRLARQAFDLADQYQIPVFVLTDQYYVDSSYNFPALGPVPDEVMSQVIETADDYQRYRFTEDGISPRGVPGFGSGFVIADCHVHDEAGHISEDFSIRTRMVKKTLHKLDALRGRALSPTLYGPPHYRYLAVCWGSNLHAAEEALDTLGRDDLAVLHCAQLYPLSPAVQEHLGRAERTIIVENNATGQFGRLINRETGHRFSAQLLKYNGLPFAVEEIVEGLQAAVGG